MMLVCVRVVKVLIRRRNFQELSNYIVQSQWSIQDRQSMKSRYFWGDWACLLRIQLPIMCISIASQPMFSNWNIISFYLSMFCRYCYVQNVLLLRSIGCIFFDSACFIQLMTRVVFPPLALPKTSRRSPSQILNPMPGQILSNQIKTGYPSGITFLSRSCVRRAISCRRSRYCSTTMLCMLHLEATFSVVNGYSCSNSSIEFRWSFYNNYFSYYQYYGCIFYGFNPISDLVIYYARYIKVYEILYLNRNVSDGFANYLEQTRKQKDKITKKNLKISIQKMRYHVQKHFKGHIQTFDSTKSNFFVTKYDRIPLMSIHGNFQCLSSLSFFLSCFSQNFREAPLIIKNLIISPLPQRICVQSVILNVYKAIYKGQRCYF